AETLKEFLFNDYRYFYMNINILDSCAPNPYQLWWEKKVRLRKLIELSGTGEIATLARLLILKRLLKRSK
ncbi:MAG TPA: hypothetical protein VJI73_01390, partial [Candidatus Paceibacterota bacterium]